MNTMHTSKETALILGITLNQLKTLVRKGIAIPDVRGNRRRPSYYSSETIERIKERLSKTANLETVIANPETATPLEALIEMNTAAEADPNMAAYLEVRSKFERMNELELASFFEPMLTRFKFSYITANCKSVQSQTLTCLKRKLKGIDTYRLDFGSFLELLKFCTENNCPTNYDEKGE